LNPARTFHSAAKSSGRKANGPFNRSGKDKKGTENRQDVLSSKYLRPMTSQGSNCVWAGERNRFSCAGYELLAADLYIVHQDVSCVSTSMSKNPTKENISSA
jgi:hypothetical protein